MNVTASTGWKLPAEGGAVRTGPDRNSLLITALDQADHSSPRITAIDHLPLDQEGRSEGFRDRYFTA